MIIVSQRFLVAHPVSITPKRAFLSIRSIPLPVRVSPVRVRLSNWYVGATP
jgi:hypothetical protein